MLRYEAHRFHDGYLQISIKDRGFLGQGIFLGEAFLPLNELKVGDMDQRLQDLPQIQLPLSKPSGFGKIFHFHFRVQRQPNAHLKSKVQVSYVFYFVGL